MNREMILNTKLTDNQIALFYLGQTGTLIQYRSTYLLIDAYLSDYVDRNCSTEQVKWKRRYPAPIDASELDFVSYVFCTHDHFDHADPDTLATLAKTNATFYCSAAIADTLERYGVRKNRVVGLRCDEATALADGATVTAVPAAHEELHPVGEGVYREVGFRFDLGGITVYHAGDCCPYDGLEERLAGCDVMALPVNGRDYYRTNVCDIIGCFNSREAALLAERCGADLLIPLHFDLYDVNGLNPAEFVDTLHTVNPSQKFHIFAPGERLIYEK